MHYYAKYFLLCFLAFFACRLDPSSIPTTDLSEEISLQWYDRIPRVRFQIPSDWEIEEESNQEEGLIIYGGHSPDNQSFLLLIGLSDAELLEEADLFILAQNKFFSGPSPIKENEDQINNLTGKRAEFVGTLGKTPVRAIAFATRWRGGIYLLLIGSQEVVASENMPRLETILKSFLGV